MYAIPYIEFQGAQWFWNSLNFLNCSGFFWYWKCTWKNPLFQACSGIVLEFRIFTIIFLRYNNSGCSLFGSPICDKIYFNCVQGSLNNRSSHQLTVIFLLYFICACFHNQIDWYDIFSSTAGLQIIFNCYQDDIQLFAKVFGKLHILVFWDLEGIQWYMVWFPSLKLGGADEFWTVITPEGWSFLIF